MTSLPSGPSATWIGSDGSWRAELKEGARLGAGKRDCKEGRILNRVVCWTQEGFSYEADPRQHEKLISELGMEGAKAMVTPVVRPSSEIMAADTELEPRKVTHFLSRRPPRLRVRSQGNL